MKHLFTALALLLAAGGAVAQKQYSNVAYYSERGVSIVLLKEPCDLPHFPPSAKKATYVARMEIQKGCYMVTGPDRVLVTLDDGASATMYSFQFQQWDIK